MAVLAVDPSSKRSGGALLGDRARIDADPADRGIFIRSMAAGERLGGLAPATRAAAQALAAAFDIVVIETVGVGQSETEVAEAADTVAVIVQPGSGDALQFLKAGIMEVPDALVVTKADLGTVATRAVRDLRAALRSLGSRTPVLAVSSVHPVSGVDELIAALDAHREGLDLAATRVRTRRLGALADFVAEHGARGLRDLGGRREAERFLAEQPPEADEPALVAALEARARLGRRALRQPAQQPPEHAAQRRLARLVAAVGRRQHRHRHALAGRGSAARPGGRRGPMPLPQPPLKYGRPPARDRPRRSPSAAVARPCAAAPSRRRGAAAARSASMWRKKRDCSRAVISERPQIARSRWKRGMPAAMGDAVDLRRPQPRHHASRRRRLFDHRIIGAEDLPLVAGSASARAHVRLAQVGDEQQRLDHARALDRAVEVAAPDVLLRPHGERDGRPGAPSA